MRPDWRELAHPLMRIKSQPLAKFPHSLAAFFLAVAVIILLLITTRDIGLTWDEPIYMVSAESYVSWYGLLVKSPQVALQAQTIQQYWEINHEHPPFDKVWSGIFWASTRNVLGDITAHRLGNILLVGLLAAILYFAVAQGYGRTAGFAAAGALLTMPRFFFHAHLAALDVPTTVTIFLVCWIFWQTIDRRGFKWTLLLGIAFGIAASTKINGLVEIPVVLFLWAFVFRRQRYIFVRLVLMGVIGCIVWLGSWPWLYFDTLSRLREYFVFLLVNHYQIAQWYRGRLYLPPPWHYPFVITLAVLPLSLTLLAAVGTIRVLLQFRNERLGWLLIISALFPILMFAFKLSEAYDGERLLMPSFPFIAALAGIGFGSLFQEVKRYAIKWNQPRWANALILLLTGLAFLPQVLEASGMYPHLLSYYSETVGTLPGAVKMGFETTYWAETYYEALPYLNKNAPQDAMIWVEAHDVMLYYQHLGLLRGDLRIASPFGSEGIVKGVQGYTDTINDADLAVIEFRQSGLTKNIRGWISNRAPVYGLSYAGVPLMQIYKR